jgi:hypothetical protein
MHVVLVRTKSKSRTGIQNTLYGPFASDQEARVFCDSCLVGKSFTVCEVQAAPGWTHPGWTRPDLQDVIEQNEADAQAAGYPNLISMQCEVAAEQHPGAMGRNKSEQ